MTNQELVSEIKQIAPNYAAHESWEKEKLELHLSLLKKLPPLPNNIGKRGRTTQG